MRETSARPVRATRADFRRFVTVTTRWNDNDVYGHVNNAVYFTYFDSAANQLLVEAGLLDPAGSEVVGLVVETACTYFSSVAFPQKLDVGVRADHIGTASVRYGLAIFTQGEDLAAAQGAFTHVYVERASQRPVAIPANFRAHLETLRHIV